MRNIKQRLLLSDKITDSTLEDLEQARVAVLADASIENILIPSTSQDDMQQINFVANKIKNNFKSLVIIGTGASSAIPKILLSLIPPPDLEVHFLENPDQNTVSSVFHKLDLKSTCFVVISKSGQTIETLAILLCAIERLENKDYIKKISDYFYFVTDNTHSYLSKIAKKLNATIITHPKTSGRFSFFASLGLLPAAICNLDINLIMKSAKDAMNNLMRSESSFLQGVAYAYEMHKNYPNHVFISYGDRFQVINLWFKQLIAESLGKDFKGINPIMATGTIDQHSQLQLYLDGPDDKYFTILIKEPQIHEISIPSKYIEEFKINPIMGKSLDSIMLSQAQIVINLLQKRNKNIRIWSVDCINEYSLSELCMALMLEVVLLGHLMGINPFDQPAVEDIKLTAKKYAFKT